MEYRTGEVYKVYPALAKYLLNSKRAEKVKKEKIESNKNLPQDTKIITPEEKKKRKPRKIVKK